MNRPIRAYGEIRHAMAIDVINASCETKIMTVAGMYYDKHLYTCEPSIVRNLPLITLLMSLSRSADSTADLNY